CVRHHHLCEPAPPGVDADGYARPPDQWRIRMGADGIPQFIPPGSYVEEDRSGLAGSRSMRGPATLYALSLFDDDESLGQGDRGRELAAAMLEGVGARPDG
ncbi:MAG TPA: hypothetical protein VF312_07850, partial [Propionibacteriaceae bacterium]